MNEEIIKNKLIWYLIDFVKQVFLSFINSKIFSSQNKYPVPSKNTSVSKGKIKFKIVRNVIIFSIFKKIIWNRLKAKILPGPDSKDFSWILDYPLKKYLVDLNEFISVTEKNSKVLDLGSGSGNFPIRLASHLSSGGRVYCVDINISSLKKLQNRAVVQKCNNIEFHRAKIEKLPFDKEVFDSAFLNMTLGQIPDKTAAFAEIKRVLKKGGYLYITELLVDNYYCLLSNVLAVAIRAGFSPVGEKGNFINYTLILKKE